MRVSVLQQEIKYGYRCFNESPDLEFLKQKANESLDDCFAMLEQASKDGADIAVTTETVNNILALGDRRFPYPQIYEGVDGATVKRFSEFARDKKMYIVAGLLLTIEGKTYNCAVLFGRDGEIVGIHRKVHLPAGEEINVSHGDRFEVFHTEIGNIGMLVCWDLQYPEAVRELALAGADIIVCPTFGWENIYGLCRAYESSVSIAAAMCYRGGFGGYSAAGAGCFFRRYRQ